jgi:hypothetical protein
MRSKFLYLATASALFLTSCGSSNVPDDKIYATDSVPTGFYQVTTPDKDPTPITYQVVYLAPTWGQANSFARETKAYVTFQVLGFILLALAGLLFYALASNRIKTSTGWAILVMVLLGLSLVSFKGTAASIKWNNKKGIPRQTYERAIQETGSTAPIWDSLKNNGMILWGPEKKK